LAVNLNGVPTNPNYRACPKRAGVMLVRRIELI
jgi:hypothetical protein